MLTFHIPGLLRPFTDGGSTIVLEGSARTVREALQELFRRHPGVRDRVLTELGELRPHVNIFVGDESIRTCGGLDAPVTADAPISIIPAVSGGR